VNILDLIARFAIVAAASTLVLWLAYRFFKWEEHR
jgi:hypothetical protein